MTAINYELLDGVFDFISRNPDRHNQSQWITGSANSLDVCNTTGCFAGHTALITGWQPQRDYGWYNNGRYTELGWHWSMNVAHPDTDERSTMPRAAMRELGLHEDQASALFGASNTVNDLGNIIQALHDDAENNVYKHTNIYRVWTDEHGKMGALGRSWKNCRRYRPCDDGKVHLVDNGVYNGRRLINA